MNKRTFQLGIPTLEQMYILHDSLGLEAVINDGLVLKFIIQNKELRGDNDDYIKKY